MKGVTNTTNYKECDCGTPFTFIERKQSNKEIRLKKITAIFICPKCHPREAKLLPLDSNPFELVSKYWQSI